MSRYDFTGYLKILWNPKVGTWLLPRVLVSWWGKASFTLVFGTLTCIRHLKHWFPSSSSSLDCHAIFGSEQEQNEDYFSWVATQFVFVVYCFLVVNWWGVRRNSCCKSCIQIYVWKVNAHWIFRVWDDVNKYFVGLYKQNFKVFPSYYQLSYRCNSCPENIVHFLKGKSVWICWFNSCQKINIAW